MIHNSGRGLSKYDFCIFKLNFAKFAQLKLFYKGLVCVCVCENLHLSETVIIDEIRPVSVDQSVEGETILPAVRNKTDELSIRERVTVMAT